mgnify:CR=1 FL=1
MKHLKTTVHLSVNNPEQALEKLLLEKEKRTIYYWRMKDGCDILVDFMSNEHLDNTIKMLERMIDERDVVVDAEAGFDDDLGCHDDTD